MQGGSAHVNYLLYTWTMQTKLGLTICYNSQVPSTLQKNYDIPCNIAYSNSTNITQPVCLVS